MTTELITETQEVHQAVVSTTTATPIQFSVTDAAIAEMEANFLNLTINGPDDKEGFKRVYDARMVVKRSRVDVDKKRKELNEDALDWQRKVNGEAKRITAQLEKIETHLELEEHAYNKERERIATEKAAAERERYQRRVLQLKDLGFVYDDTVEAYHLADLWINKDDLKQLSDEDYSPTVQLAEKTAKTEQERLAELQRVADEKARLEAEAAKAEQNRMAEERRVLAEQQAELKLQQDALLAEQKQLKDEQDRATINSRVTRLLNAGWVEEEFGLYSRPNTQLRRANILAFTDELFDQVISETVTYFERKEAERLQSIQDEAENLRLRTAADKAQKKADKERQKLLKPDKKQLMEFFTTAQITGKHMKGLNLPESQELELLFFNRFGSLISEFMGKVDQL